MKDEDWKKTGRDAAVAEFLKRAAAEQKSVADYCVAWIAMAARLGLKEKQPC